MKNSLPKTVDDLKAMDKPLLTANEVGNVLGINPHCIRLEARDNPERLGFRTICYGRQVRVPRLAFIKFMEGDEVSSSFGNME